MYRYAVLGLGDDGLRHVRALRAAGVADCVAVYDDDSERLEGARKLFPEIPAYASLGSLLPPPHTLRASRQHGSGRLRLTDKGLR